MDLTKYGFEIVGRAPAPENDVVAHFTKRGLKAKKLPGLHDEIFRISVDLGKNSVSVGVMENSVGLFHKNEELFYIFDYSFEILSVVAELIAKASKWPDEIHVGEYKLNRLGFLHYQSQKIDNKFLELLVEDGGDYSTIAFHAQLFDMKKNDCASDISEEASKVSEVLDLNGIKSLLKRAVEEAK
jgi:hypothetical protein